MLVILIYYFVQVFIEVEILQVEFKSEFKSVSLSGSQPSVHG